MTQKDLFAVPEKPPKARAYLLKREPPRATAPAPAATPAREEQPPARGFDYKAHQAAGRHAAPGTRYCFEHEKWEYGVGMWLDGRRWVFYCEAAGRARGAKKYTGNPSKPTEE